MTRSSRLAALVLAGLFLALHLPFLPASLEDLDSINFALGVRDYDVAQHQPHPPGYPLFIAAAKVIHALGLSEVHALALLSVIGGTLGVLAAIGLFTRLFPEREAQVLAPVAAVVMATNPLYWLTSVRPLSDLSGLAASLAVHVLTLSATTPLAFAFACGAAAFAAGIRSQVVWLTVPLLFLALWRQPAPARVRAALYGVGAFGVGGLLWFVPLVVVSGGPVAYLAALSAQGAEDLTGVTMLATTPSVRQLLRSLQYALLAPWGYWQAGALVIALGLVGLVQMWRAARSALLALALAFGPYFVFDLLFQETVTTRYALPLVVPASYLMVRGLLLLMSDTPAVVAAVALAAFSASVNDGTIARYARPEAPAFRMLGDWALAARGDTGVFTPPALAMHRREEFDLRRTMSWRRDQVPTVERRIPSTAKHEWLEVVKYWNDGGMAPVWFVADPLRSDLALIHARTRPTRYRWGFEPSVLLGGSRPSQMDWHVIATPDWYLGEGWALTPETAGIAREDGRGPGLAPIEGWIRRSSGPVTVMLGGRNLTATGAMATLHVEVDGRQMERIAVSPGFFLTTLHLPSLEGAGRYASVRVSSDNRDLAIEQFDAQPADRVLAGFAEGWHEHEYNPTTGALWRWTSERAVLRIHAGGHAVSLTLRGEIEAASRSRVTIRVGQRTLTTFELDQQFERTVLLPADALTAEETDLVIETSETYVPADTRWGSTDRRRLGLRLFDCRVAPAS